MEIVHLSPHSRHCHKGTASKYGTNTQADFEKLVQDGLKATQSEGYIDGPRFEKPTPESINVDPTQAEMGRFYGIKEAIADWKTAPSPEVEQPLKKQGY